ncbi:hypothetical protein [Streptomyces abikoensis]|uniref:Uncharacterized protein n=1 Tax=Streptomyces abikoensis TaxID=97398 RepID=A0ABW7T4W1_9ACTN
MTSSITDPRPRISVAEAQRVELQAVTTARGLALMVADTLRAMYQDAAYLVFSWNGDVPALVALRDTEGRNVCDLTRRRIPALLEDGTLRVAWGEFDPQDTEHLEHLIAMMDSLGGEFDDLPEEQRTPGDAEWTQCLSLSPNATFDGSRAPGPRRLRPYGSHRADIASAT